MKAILFDATRCIGCRGCQVACKQWNGLSAEATTFFAGDGYQNPRDLSASTWNLVTFTEMRVGQRFEWVFGKRQCMHCVQPACVDSCPALALEKLAAGPVVYHAERCLGCRYCMLACPFQVPRFEWHSALPRISKCTMCADRVQAGLEPACVKACPTDALVFGEREALLADAEARIHRNPSGYVAQVYGKEEVGGTSLLHLSSVPFAAMGYREQLPKAALGNGTALAMHAVPGVVFGLSLGLGVVSWVVNRRVQAQERAQQRPPEDGGAEA
jgi:formate dehydrogenase iron-sulfur subunit